MFVATIYVVIYYCRELHPYYLTVDNGMGFYSVSYGPNVRRDNSINNGSYKIGALSSPEVASAIDELLSSIDNIQVASLSRPPQQERPQLIIYEPSHNGDGMQDKLLSFMRECNGNIPVIAVTKKPDYRKAIGLMRAGFKDYIDLSNEKSKLYRQIESYYKTWQREQEKKEFQDFTKHIYDFSQIIGNSQHIKKMLDILQKVIRTEGITVLIRGETGTGKELVAKALHYNSINSKDPFVEIACTAIPDTLLESELFGYEKGAFTDARDKKAGLFEIAGNGTIFLDEIGDISPAIQSKLLKVIEEKKFRRLGSLQDIPINARIISATGVNLEHMVESGKFRSDLYYRLNVVPIELPPLRQRKEDIPVLAEHFLQQFNKEYKKEVEGFSHRAMDFLLEYTWPGNVRELKHSIERAVLLVENGYIEDTHFSIKINSQSFDAEQFHTANNNYITFNLPITNATLEDAERHLVKKVLHHTQGNKTKAARIMKISRPKLDRIIKRNHQHI